MSGIYILLILSSIVSVGTALKCYKCRSSISWADCIYHQESKNGTCYPYRTRCGKAEVRITNKNTGKIAKINYVKDCWKMKKCSNIVGCHDLYDFDDDDALKYTATCTVQCCSGDNCNSGLVVVPTSSAPATQIVPVSRCPSPANTGTRRKYNLWALGHVTPAVISVALAKMY